MSIQVKRAYEPPDKRDGFRVLVDRIWPRGVSKEEARIDSWEKEIAPSNALRKWFGHEREKWPAFKTRYFAELKEHSEVVEQLRLRSKDECVTLVFAAKDAEHNNAVALKEYLENWKRASQ